MWLIDGVVQHYPWGSKHFIPTLLELTPDGDPWAEYWLGTHPLGVSQLVEESQSLARLLVNHPSYLGKQSLTEFGPRLPFLMKVLALEKPLSLQAHPNRAQAEAGFTAEQNAGIAYHAPERVFKDPYSKPELVVALTTFEALCGFRDPKISAELFAELPVHESLDSIIGPLTERSGPAALAEVFLDVLSVGEDRRHLVDEVVAAAVNLMDAEGELGEFARTAVELDEHFPSDPGILAAMLANRVRLEPGQAIYTPAGSMHAYLRGSAIEAQANSDNVLRGALTKKHVDVDGLISVVNFEPTTKQILEPNGSDGLYYYETPANEFKLWMLRPTEPASYLLPVSESARIALATKGEFSLETSAKKITVPKGKAAFLAAGEQVTAAGQGQLFVQSVGLF